MENRKAVPQKMKNTIDIWSCNSISAYVSKGTESRILNSYLYTHVQGSTIHNSQKVEAIKDPLTDEMDKSNVAHTYNNIQS